MLIAVALNDLQWGPFANTLVTLAVVLAYVPVDRVIGRWYDERYGHVTPVHHDRVRAVGLTLAILSTAALLIAMVLVLTTSTSWWPALPALPINAVPLVGGLLALAIYRVRSGLRGHNAVVWGAVVAVSAMPIWHDHALKIAGGLLLFGVAAIVNGVLDHLALVRLFGPPTGDAEGARG